MVGVTVTHGLAEKSAELVLTSADLFQGMRQIKEPFFNEFFFAIFRDLLFQLFLSLSFEVSQEVVEARVVLDAIVAVPATIFQKENLAGELNFRLISTEGFIRRIVVATQRIVM